MVSKLYLMMDKHIINIIILRQFDYVDVNLIEVITRINANCNMNNF